MSDQRIPITCPRCGHTWTEDLAALDHEKLVVYKDGVECREYRVRCPRCGTGWVVTVEVEEENDGQAARG